jgi:hypothetical protein
MTPLKHPITLHFRIAVGAVLMPLGPVSLVGQDIEPTSDMRIVAQLELQKPTYSLRDTARISITLVNASDGQVPYVPLGPSDMIHLVVKRNGKLLTENTGEGGTAGIQVPGGVLAPHHTLLQVNVGTLRVVRVGERTSASLVGHKIERWLPLTQFGYELDEPGHYTIEGVPQIGNRAHMVDTRSGRSNVVTFTITK